MEKHIIGIDFGTTTLSGVIINLDKQKIVFSKTIETNAYIHFADELKKEQSISKIEACFFTLLQEMFSMDIEIVSIGLTGQMHGIVGLDAGLKPVTNLVTWQDKSGELEMGNGKSLFQTIKEIDIQKFVSSGFGILTLYKWLNIDKKSDIKTICTIPDYFANVLTQNSKIFTDASLAHSLGCFDTEKNNWDDIYLNKLKISRSLFPEITGSAIIIGKLTNPKALSFSKLKREVKISNSLGDNQASFIGSVSKFENSLLINIGTGSQLSFAVRKKDISGYGKFIDGFDTELRPLCEDYYLVAINILSGGTVYKTIYNFFMDCATELFDINRNDISEVLWQKMEALTSTVPDANKLSVFPLFNGTRSNPQLKGKVENISVENFKPANLINATLEGIADYYKSLLPDFFLKNVKTIIGTGNGIKKNKLLVQNIERKFGIKLTLPNFNEEASVGAAINSAISSGFFNNLSDSGKFIDKLN